MTLAGKADREERRLPLKPLKLGQIPEKTVNEEVINLKVLGTVTTLGQLDATTSKEIPTPKTAQIALLLGKICHIRIEPMAVTPKDRDRKAVGSTNAEMVEIPPINRIHPILGN